MRVGERLFDLGSAGILQLTLSNFGAWEPPFPANRYGRARLHIEGKTHDRLEALTRPVSRATIEKTIAESRSRLAGAVRAVHANIDWVAAQVSDDFREAPSDARAMSDGLVVVTFAAAVQPHAIRIVDVRRGEIVWEATLEEIARLCDISKQPRMGLTIGDYPMLQAAGGQHVALMTNLATALLEWTGNEIRPLPWIKAMGQVSDLYATAGHIVLQRDRDKNEYEVLDGAGTLISPFEAPTRSKGWTDVVTSAGSERIVLPAEGGTVDIVDGFGSSSFAIRPYPRTGRTDRVGCALSFEADFLGVSEWQSFRVVDLAARKVTEIPVPPPLTEDAPGSLIYGSDVIALSSQVAVVYQGRLIVHPYESLDWQKVVEPGRRRVAGVRAEVPEYQRLLPRWKKTALRLEPARGSARSHLYGAPRLPEARWPRHDGIPMLLLAEIDLAEVRAVASDNPWPAKGVLCFFVAVDDAGEALLDEMFNPRGARVVWQEDASDQARQEAGIHAQPLELFRHDADLPDIGAAIVMAEGLNDGALEAYRSYLEAHGLADQPPGHRLGGYPTILQNNDLEAQAAHVVDKAEYPPASLQSLKEASRWQLLLQLDSDEVFMWGTDSGMLYFLVNSEDLARRRFDRVVALCEGY